LLFVAEPQGVPQYEILRELVIRIRREELLFVLALALIEVLLAFYAPQTLDTIQTYLIVIFLIAAILIGLDRVQAYRSWEGSRLLSEYRQKLEQLRQEKAALEEELKKRMEKVAVGSGLDQYSINLDFEAVSAAVDKEHTYTRVGYFADVDVEGNYKARYERDGLRVAKGNSKSITISTGASFPIDYKQLTLKAYNLKTGKRLNDRCIDDADRYRKIYSIDLDPIVPFGKDFSIAWEFTWPHCCASKNDSDTINLGYFAEGVDRLQYSITFPFEISHPLLQEIPLGEKKLVDSDTQPTQGRKGEKFVYSFEIQKPKVKGYLLSWTAP
jgi:hypothetical protein